ncbi:GNAT family N-acetyltransferase [Streptomyces sp. NPDC048442]|uniref:GNAT family N-acetyltransferase n=1 Tax=Streptomyces sp. NPDC048442 TaxID=3154823 RepID=UPI0034263BB6
MEHLIRRVRADEWQQVRDLRLAALLDPMASIAFHDTYELAAARPDSMWQERAAGAASGEQVAQFVAEAPDGSWDGTVTALIERPGEATGFASQPVVDQAHAVGVFVRSTARGSGLAEELFRAVVEWSWEVREPRPVERVRLFVHESNVRAEGLYRKCGFERTGTTVPAEGDPSTVEIEMAVQRPR